MPEALTHQAHHWQVRGPALRPHETSCMGAATCMAFLAGNGAATVATSCPRFRLGGALFMVGWHARCSGLAYAQSVRATGGRRPTGACLASEIRLKPHGNSFGLMLDHMQITGRRPALGEVATSDWAALLPFTWEFTFETCDSHSKLCT